MLKKESETHVEVVLENRLLTQRHMTVALDSLISSPCRLSLTQCYSDLARHRSLLRALDNVLVSHLFYPEHEQFPPCQRLGLWCESESPASARMRRKGLRSHLSPLQNQQLHKDQENCELL